MSVYFTCGVAAVLLSVVQHSRATPIQSASGKCLDADDDTYPDDGTKVQLWECNGGATQQWTVKGGRIQSASGKCLDADDDSYPDDGTKLQLWECNTGPTQQWTVTNDQIQSESGKCVDADDDTYPDDGTKVQLWECHDGDSDSWSLGPAPAPPPPSPPPSPPSPGPPGPSPPGPLPPIPDQVWFAVWASDEDSNPFTSVVFDIWDDAVIQQQGGPALRFLYQVGQFFYDLNDGKCDWYSDYQSRWNAAVPKLKQMLMDRKLLGFMTGDESVDKGLPADKWEIVINTVRDTFPQGTAIIYTNDYVCRDEVTSKCIDNIPPALDWISSATYREDKSDGFVDSVRDSYKDHIYPKLHSHQKVALIPGAGQADWCDDQCAAEVELQDAKDFVAWANDDSRVAFIAPYLWRFDDGMKNMDHGDDLRQYWSDFGTGTKPDAHSEQQLDKARDDTLVV